MASAEAGRVSADGSSNDQGDDLALVVRRILSEMYSKFYGMSGEIVDKIDKMSNRIEDLERQIGDLMKSAGDEGVDGDSAGLSAASAGGQ